MFVDVFLGLCSIDLLAVKGRTDGGVRGPRNTLSRVGSLSDREAFKHHC